MKVQILFWDISNLLSIHICKNCGQQYERLSRGMAAYDRECSYHPRRAVCMGSISGSSPEPGDAIQWEFPCCNEKVNYGRIGDPIPSLKVPSITPGCKSGKHKPDSSWKRPRQVKSQSRMYDYDVALSFAGEDREYVQNVARVLTEVGIKVFYDKYESAELWGKDLVEHLDGIYRKRSRYCVMFISRYYAKKVWPKHERRSAQARALISKRDYVLPARFDKTELPGLQPTIGYINLDTVTPEEFAHLIIEKLGMRSEIDELIKYLASYLKHYQITVDGTDLHFFSEAEGYDNYFPLRLMLEMHRADQVERMFLMPAIVPF